LVFDIAPCTSSSDVRAQRVRVDAVLLREGLHHHLQDVRGDLRLLRAQVALRVGEPVLLQHVLALLHRVEQRVLAEHL
jgi:hypothetical protein